MPLASPMKCKHLLSNPKNDFCMVAAGRNPALKTGPMAGKDWYGTPQWQAVKFGPSWCKHCFWCDVTGHYQGVLEKAAMVSSEDPEDDFLDHSLKAWCREMGENMYQDSVLVREAPRCWLLGEAHCPLEAHAEVHLVFTYGAQEGQEKQMQGTPYTVDPEKPEVMFSQITPTFGMGYAPLSEYVPFLGNGRRPPGRKPMLQRSRDFVHLDREDLGDGS